MTESDGQKLSVEKYNHFRFPGLELSRVLRHKLLDRTRQDRLVEKAANAVIHKAFDEKHPDVTWLGSENEAYDQAAELLGRSTIIGITGSSGGGFGFAAASDVETIGLGQSPLSRDIVDTYGAALQEEYGMHVDTNFAQVVTQGPGSSPSGRSDTLEISGLRLEDPIFNPSLVTKLLMTEVLWGDGKMLESIKQSIKPQDLVWVGLYAALAESPNSIRTGVSEDPIKYGMGGNRAILYSLNIACSLLGDLSFFSGPERMADNMVENGLINVQQHKDLLKAMSDFIICRSLAKKDELNDENIFPWSQIESYIPPDFVDPQAAQHIIRADRKNTLQIYYHLREQVLAPLGFGGRVATEFKTWDNQRQIDFVLQGDPSHLQERISAGILLTKSIDVIKVLYEIQDKPSWLSGLAIAKFLPKKHLEPAEKKRQAEVHETLLEKVLSDNDTHWKNEPYLKSTIKKSSRFLGYNL